MTTRVTDAPYARQACDINYHRNAMTRDLTSVSRTPLNLRPSYTGFPPPPLGTKRGFLAQSPPFGRVKVGLWLWLWVGRSRSLSMGRPSAGRMPLLPATGNRRDITDDHPHDGCTISVVLEVHMSDDMSSLVGPQCYVRGACPPMGRTTCSVDRCVVVVVVDA